MAVQTTSGKDKILRWLRVFYGGYELSGDARTIGTMENMFGEADVTGWNEALRNFISDTRREVGISGFQCLMNDDTNKSMDLLKNPNSSNRVSILFGGGGEPTDADPAYFLPSVHVNTSTDFDSPLGVLQADFLMDAAQYDANTSNPFGIVLINKAVTALDVRLSHDNEGSTTNGWHANLHITATASGNFSFIVQDSPDDAVYSELDTFTADGSAITSEHMSGSGTVDRYVRMRAEFTAGTCTAICTFARN
jgi:hypothetical protein